MACDRMIGPFPCCSVVQGDCLELMRGLYCVRVDAIITDPPYGCGKADWDDDFPWAWYGAARIVADIVAIITGSAGLKDSVALVGSDFIDVIAARNLNGMTRGPIGFGNWLGAVVACGKPRQGPNAFDFCVTGEMPKHPSPKPIEYMEKLIDRLTDLGKSDVCGHCGKGIHAANERTEMCLSDYYHDHGSPFCDTNKARKAEPSVTTILDPFCGSGTTLVAAKKLGRHFLGFEISPEYCEIARKRIAAVEAQPTLFEPKPEQGELGL